MAAPLQIVSRGTRDPLLLEEERGILRIWSPAHDAMATHVAGHLSLGFARTIMDYADRQFARSTRLVGFHDWEEMMNYASSARLELSTWAFHRRTKMGALHFLVKSKIVLMGLSVANLTATVKVVTHPERLSFDRAVAECLRAPGG